MNQTLLTVRLPENAFSSSNPRAVFGIIGRLLVRKHVPKRRVSRQRQSADFVVNFSNGTELARQVYVRLDVDRLEPLWKPARFSDAVVFFNVLARTGDGQQIEQLEVIEAEHFQEMCRTAFRVLQGKPAIELKLRLPDRRFNACDAVTGKRRIVGFGHEGDLVLEIRQAVVDRRGREHQHTGLDSVFDDAAHEPVITCLASIVGRFVSEVVGFVDDDEIVVSPVHMGKVDIAGGAAVAREVGVIENVVIEAVGSEEVTAVIRLVERPIVAQAFGYEHEYAVVAQLVIFDDGKSLEGLTKADAIGNDAAAKALKFVDGPDDAVLLELVQLLPDRGVADTRRRLDNTVFVNFFAKILENLKQDQVVDQRRGFGIHKFLEALKKSSLILI